MLTQNHGLEPTQNTQNPDKSGYRESDEPLTDRACVRCAHHRVSVIHGYNGGHRCARPQLGSSYDPVTGANLPNVQDCYDERGSGGLAANGPDACGPEGKFWSQSGF